MDIKKNKDNIIDRLDFINIKTFETIRRWIEEETKELIPVEYEHESYDMLDEVVAYAKQKMEEIIKMKDSEFIKRIIAKVKSHDKQIKDRLRFENCSLEVYPDIEWVEEPDDTGFAIDIIELIEQYEHEKDDTNE